MNSEKPNLPENMGGGIPKKGPESAPILEKPRFEISDCLDLFDSTLELTAKDPELTRKLFSLWVGDMVYHDHYSYEDFKRDWGDEIPEDKPAHLFKVFKDAFESMRLSRPIVSLSEVEKYFSQEELGGADTTASMLRELEKHTKDESPRAFKIANDFVVGRFDVVMGLPQEAQAEVVNLVGSILREAAFHEKTLEKAPGHAILEYLSEKYPKFDFKKLPEIWKERFSTQLAFFKTIGLDLWTIVQLEQKDPGITERLIKEFGIKNIGRYPVELLTDQIEVAEDTGRPYGVVISSSADWNTSMHSDAAVMSEFYQKLKELGDNLRILETTSKRDLAVKLLGLDKKYGASQKISFAVLNGHGNEDLIELGFRQAEDKTKDPSILHKEALKDKESLAVKRLFIPEPTIVLGSCSTGKEKGIGQLLSRLMGATVIAPVASAFLKKLEIEKGHGETAIFKAEYLHYDIEEETETPVDAAVFKNGEKIS